jgi:hypothetical protein
LHAPPSWLHVIDFMDKLLQITCEKKKSRPIRRISSS